MEADHVTTESTIKRNLFKDITAFLKHFSSFDPIKYGDFSCQWNKQDLSLLTLVSSPDSIILALLQTGLFIPTRPFRDHQLLIFFLFSLFKTCKEPIKLSADRIQFLVGVRMRAGMLKEVETVEALDVLFKRDAFIVIAEEDRSLLSQNITTNPYTSTSASIDQLHDRIKRIESFLQSHPLFDQKLSKNSLTRLKSLFERYCDSKCKNQIVLREEQDFGSVMGNIMRIVDGYEQLICRFVGTFHSNQCSSKSRSIRSRLTQSSLTPIMPASCPSSPADLFMSSGSLIRPQSVPVTKVRRTSSLRELDLDEFIENSTSATNMPNINFY